MANSITGINDDIIARAALEGFVAGLMPVNAFTTNFSGDAVKRGEKISVLRTLAADDAGDFVPATGYTIQDADSDAVEILLNKHKFVSWGLTDTEVSQSSLLNMEVYGFQKGFKLAKAVFQDILSDITAANYGAAVFTGAANTFDADDVVDIRTACTAADMPPEMRSIIIDEDYTGALLKDNAIQDASAIGDNKPIREGTVGRLSGFDMFESTLIPANGENLVGIAANPSGMLVAMRYLAPQEGHKYNRAEAFTHPKSGITMGLRDWYDENGGQRRRVFECVYGKIPGIAAGIKRIVSA